MTRPFTEEDLAMLKRLRAEGVPGRVIAERMERAHTVIEFQVKRHKLPLPPKPELEVPADFRRQWCDKSIMQLAAHYGKSEHAIRKIVRKLGLKRAKFGQNISRIVPTKAPPNRYMTAARMPSSKAELTAAGRAADYLRGFYVPVHRCNDAGMFSPGASLWRCGTRIFDDREIVVRAEEVRGRRERMRGAA